MKLIDSHIHLDFPVFDEDREVLVNKAMASGIERFVVPATTKASWSAILDLTHTYSSISPAYGIHPYFVEAHSIADCAALERWVSGHPCIAIGETGLDYFLPHLDRAQQKALFTAQLDIAKNHQLPVILHARKAVEEVFLCVKKYHIRSGIVHSFNGSLVQAMRFIDMGFKLGFGGAITYSRATRLRALIKQLPLEAICLETDAPDQPSQHYQAKRNEPTALLEVLACICDIYDLSPEEVAKQTTHNTLSVLKAC